MPFHSSIGALVVLMLIIKPVHADRIIVKESNAGLLSGTWEGRRTLDTVHQAWTGETSVTVTITEGPPRSASFVTDDQRSWHSRVHIVDGDVLMDAWWVPRTFGLFRVDSETLLLESQWEFHHRIWGLTEVNLRFTKKGYDKNLLKD